MAFHLVMASNLDVMAVLVCVPSLIVSMPVALRAGASALFDWMHSYSVYGVGVDIDSFVQHAS